VISAVFVSYHSAPLALRAVASFREDARRGGLAAEAVCVVNSGDAEEARALREVADRVVVPAGNAGYAGGLNAGIAVAGGDTLILANPDVEFLPGAVAALDEAARAGGAAMAGPVLYLDGDATILHPPAEEPGPAEVSRRVLARDRARGARVFRRSARRALSLEALARSGGAGEAEALSGALMAVTRETAGRLGPLDERYTLYHEENDWQRRLRAAGGRLVVAGGARVVHRYAQSSRREPRAEVWFRQTERLFFESHFGERGLRALARDREARPPLAPEPRASRRLAWEAGGEALVALSPVPWFRPFALFRPAPGPGTFGLPADVARAHEGAVWYARAFDAATFEPLSEARLARG